MTKLTKNLINEVLVLDFEDLSILKKNIEYELNKRKGTDLETQIDNNELEAIEKQAEELQLNEAEEREWNEGDL